MVECERCGAKIEEGSCCGGATTCDYCDGTIKCRGKIHVVDEAYDEDSDDYYWVHACTAHGG